MKQKQVAYEYFEVVTYDEKGNQKPYDLTNYFKALKKLGAKDSTIDFRGEKARVQKVIKNTTEWEGMFVRLRTSLLPGIASDSGEFEMIKVEDGKYIGEFTSVLYEYFPKEKRSTLVIHRNQHGFAPSSLEEYMNKGLKRKIELVPIIGKSRLDRIKKSKILRSIELSVREEALMSLKNSNNSVINVLSNLDYFGGHKLKFKVSMGHMGKDKSLDLSKTKAIIEEAYNLQDLDTLKIGYVEDNRIENVDLLLDRVIDYRRISYDNNNPLDHSIIFERLLDAYRDRRSKGKIF